jgi:hypothetical protein
MLFPFSKTHTTNTKQFYNMFKTYVSEHGIIIQYVDLALQPLHVATPTKLLRKCTRLSNNLTKQIKLTQPKSDLLEEYTQMSQYKIKTYYHFLEQLQRCVCEVTM